MNAVNVNLVVRCVDCTFADAFGRSCKHGLLVPLVVLMNGIECPNFKFKSQEQIKDQDYQRKAMEEKL